MAENASYPTADHIAAGSEPADTADDLPASEATDESGEPSAETTEEGSVPA